MLRQLLISVSVKVVSRYLAAKYPPLFTDTEVNNHHLLLFLAHAWSERITWSNMPRLKLGRIQGYAPSYILQFSTPVSTKIKVLLQFETRERLFVH